MTDVQKQVDQVVEAPSGVSIGEILEEQGVTLIGGLTPMAEPKDGRKPSRQKPVADDEVVGGDGREHEEVAETEEVVEEVKPPIETEAEPELTEAAVEVEVAVIEEVAPESVEAPAEIEEPDDADKVAVVEAAIKNIVGFPFGVVEPLKIAFGAAFDLGTARMDVLRDLEKVPELGMRCLICDRAEVSQTRFVHCGGECGSFGAVAQQVLNWVVSQSPSRGQHTDQAQRPQQRSKPGQEFEEVVVQSVTGWGDPAMPGNMPQRVRSALWRLFRYGQYCLICGAPVSRLTYLVCAKETCQQWLPWLFRARDVAFQHHQSYFGGAQRRSRRQG